MQRAPTVHVTRQHVAGHCPECQSSALARYPVFAQHGWFECVRCQVCLNTLHLRRLPERGRTAALGSQS
jgi:hypothetical protein